MEVRRPIILSSECLNGVHHLCSRGDCECNCHSVTMNRNLKMAFTKVYKNCEYREPSVDRQCAHSERYYCEEHKVCHCPTCDKDAFTKVCVAGKFDPIHSGHIDHIRKARKQGDYLIVITHPDHIIKAEKGYCLMPLEDRIEVLSALRYVDQVVVSIDKDSTCADTLRLIKPDKFVKGGSRTPENMPPSEIAVCKELGIEIVYNQGDLLNSSSALLERAIKDWIRANEKRTVQGS